MEEIKQTQSDVDEYKAINVMSKSEGGQIIINTLKRDLCDLIDSLISKYKSEDDFNIITAVALIDAKTQLLRVLLRAEKNERMAKEYLDTLTQ